MAGGDVFLFVSLALICAAFLFGKLSAVWVLIAGGVLGAVNKYANLLRISNSIALWLGISPPDIFFYAVRRCGVGWGVGGWGAGCRGMVPEEAGGGGADWQR